MPAGKSTASKKKASEKSKPKVEAKKVENVEEKNQPPYVMAALFIFIGIVLLLNTTGVIGWGVWLTFWRFWPLVVIILGVKMLFGEKGWINGLVAFVTVLFLMLLLLMTFVIENVEGFANKGVSVPNWVEDLKESWSSDVGEEIELTESLEDVGGDVEKRSVEISLGAGEFSLLSTDEEEYFSHESKYYEGYGVPSLDSDLEDGTLEVTFDTDYKTGLWRNAFKAPSYDLFLGYGDLETDVSIDLGAGEGTVILEDLTISEFSANLGAGDLDVEFDENSLPSDKLDIDVGAGDMTLVLPEGVGYEVTYDVGVGSLDLDGTDVSGVGNNGTYESKDLEDYDTVIEININVGVGSFSMVVK